MRYIIMPQAFKAIIPPLGKRIYCHVERFLFSFCYRFRGVDTSWSINHYKTYASFEIWGTVAVIYLIMTVTISQLVDILKGNIALND